MAEEIWKDVEGFEGYYKVSNRGRFLRVSPYRYGKNERLLNPVNLFGYLRVSMTKGGDFKQATHPAHRLVARAFIPNPENKPFINHINGVKSDNRVENLEWCTQSENMKHAIETGLFVAARGERQANAKLKTTEVVEIKHLLASNESPVGISKIYKVSKQTILDIKRGITWKHVK